MSLPSMNAVYLKGGLQIAIDDFNLSKWAIQHGVRVDLVEYPCGRKDLDVIRSFMSAVNSDALAVIGLDTSKEALLVGKLAQDNRILTITTSGAHDRIGMYGDYVFSMVSSISTYTKEISEYVKGLNASKVLIVANYDEPYSKSMSNKLSNDLINNSNVYRVMTSKDILIDKTKMNELRNVEYDVVIIATYTYPGVLLLNQLMDAGVVVSQPVIVSPAWYYDHTTIKKHLKRVGHIVCFTTWSTEWRDILSKEFIRKYERNYGIVPSAGDALSYDAANILFKALRRVKQYNREELKREFIKIKKYRGSTGWRYYDNCSNHPRSSFFINIINDQKEFELSNVGVTKRNERCRD